MVELDDLGGFFQPKCFCDLQMVRLSFSAFILSSG